MRTGITRAPVTLCAPSSGARSWCPTATSRRPKDPEVIKQRQPDHWMPRLMQAMFAGPGHKVDQVLREGDDVAGVSVLDTPGHSAGHVSSWRECDRFLIWGCVTTTMHPFLMTAGVRGPFDFFTP